MAMLPTRNKSGCMHRCSIRLPGRRRQLRRAPRSSPAASCTFLFCCGIARLNLHSGTLCWQQGPFLTPETPIPQPPQPPLAARGVPEVASQLRRFSWTSILDLQLPRPHHGRGRLPPAGRRSYGQAANQRVSDRWSAQPEGRDARYALAAATCTGRHPHLSSSRRL